MSKIYRIFLLLVSMLMAGSAQASFWEFTGGLLKGLYNNSLGLITGGIGAAPTFLQKLASFDICWFCGPFATIFDVINTIVTEVCKTMQPIFLTFLGLLFLFWLLFRVGKVVLDITPNADTQLVPDLLKQIMKVIVASLMLSFYLDVFSYLISPALEMSIGLGNTISLNQMADGQLQEGVRTGKKTGSSTEKNSLCPEYKAAIKKAAADSSSGTTPSTAGQAVYPDVVKEAFICYIRVGCASMNMGMALGATAVSSWAHKNVLTKIYHIDLLVIGVTIFLAYFLLLLAFPTKLFDPLMTLTFVSALFPLWIVFWAFPGTKKYFDKALGMFLGVLVHLIVISIITMMVVQVMNAAFGDNTTQEQLFGRLLAGEDPYTVFNTTEGFGVCGKVWVLVIALSWLSGKMFEKTAAIAGQFENVIDFGTGKGAAAVISTVTGSLADTGKQGVAAVGHGVQLGFNRVAQRDDTLGKVARGASAGLAGVAAGVAAAPTGLGLVAGLGAAAATWRKMPVPKNRPHDGSFSDRMNVETEEDADNKWKLNIKRGVSSAQNKATKEFEKYDRNTQMYQEFDSASRLQNEYDRKKGQISLMNKKYDFAVHAEDGSMTIEFDGVKYSVDLHGVVKNLTSGVSVDPQTAQEVKNVADFQRHAEQRIAAHEAKLNR